MSYLRDLAVKIQKARKTKQEKKINIMFKMELNNKDSQEEDIDKEKELEQEIA